MKKDRKNDSTLVKLSAALKCPSHFQFPEKLKANLGAMSRRQRLQRLHQEQCVPKSKCDSTWVT